MQSCIYTSGYGFRKSLCQNVTAWFLNKFLPHHKITVEILHRGLKREGVVGYCDFVGNSYKPREFLIELDTHMNEELYIKTLIHELVHLRQWTHGSLQFRYGKMCYCKDPVEKYDYEFQPHEIEAREQEETLYLEYLQETQDAPVPEVSQRFLNRLMQAV
jgi:hypothetical protein